MVAAVTGARRAPGGLRRAGGVGELREDGRAAGGDQALLLEGGEHGALVGGGDRRSRVLDDREDGLPEFGIAQTAGGRADDFVRGLDDVALAGHVDGDMAAISTMVRAFLGAAAAAAIGLKAARPPATGRTEAAAAAPKSERREI